jgi:transcriptional regulator with XRE-family HTH domain
MNSIRVKFGNRVRQLRISKNLSQMQLAEKAALSVDFVSLVERGLRGPSLDTIEKFATALDIEIYLLFIWDE